jgi:hypothetical protein
VLRRELGAQEVVVPAHRHHLRPAQRRHPCRPASSSARMCQWAGIA